jgi:hypothetical protein
MKRASFPLSLLLVLGALAAFGADTVQRIYTAPDPAANGGLRGTVSEVITHAIAVNHDRLRVYRAEESNGGRTFEFPHLPIGKYDLVLVGKDGVVYEGLDLGAEKPPVALPAGSMEHLKTRVEAQDAFFNHCRIQRVGFDGSNALVFVERTTDRQTLKQDGTLLGATIRRLEIMEIAQATDDWQVTTTRHLYREEQGAHGIGFLKHAFVPELGNLRVIDNVKDLGSILLPSL